MTSPSALCIEKNKIGGIGVNTEHHVAGTVIYSCVWVGRSMTH